MTNTINLGIIEDERLVLDSLEALFSANPTFSIKRMSMTVEAFLEMPFREEIHVVLLDIQLLGGMSGLEGIRHIKNKLPKADVIMLTTLEDSDKIFKALCAGAVSYISKRTPFPKIMEAVQTVHHGGSYMSPGIARKVVEHFAPKKKAEHDALSPRQQQIVEGMLDGLSYKMIADKLLLSTETVRHHIKHIYQKLEINSKGELMKKKLEGELGF